MTNASRLGLHRRIVVMIEIARNAFIDPLETVSAPIHRAESPSVRFVELKFGSDSADVSVQRSGLCAFSGAPHPLENAGARDQATDVLQKQHCQIVIFDGQMNRSSVYENSA